MRAIVTQSYVSVHLPAPLANVVMLYFEIEPNSISGYHFGLTGLWELAVCNGVDWISALAGALDGEHEALIEHILSSRYYYIIWDELLVHACIFGRMRLVHLAISHGANSWNRGLWQAAASGHTEIAELMIKNGADNLRESIHAAKWHHKFEMAKFIRTYGH